MSEEIVVVVDVVEAEVTGACVTAGAGVVSDRCRDPAAFIIETKLGVTLFKLILSGTFAEGDDAEVEGGGQLAPGGDLLQIMCRKVSTFEGALVVGGLLAGGEILGGANGLGGVTGLEGVGGLGGGADFERDDCLEGSVGLGAGGGCLGLVDTEGLGTEGLGFELGMFFGLGGC